MEEGPKPVGEGPSCGTLGHWVSARLLRSRAKGIVCWRGTPGARHVFGRIWDEDPA